MRAQSHSQTGAFALAYHLLIAIEKILLDQAIHTSWAAVRDALKTHQICTIVLPTADGSCLRIRKAATAEPNVQDLYRRLAISPQIIEPQHSWSAAPIFPCARTRLGSSRKFPP